MSTQIDNGKVSYERPRNALIITFTGTSTFDIEDCGVHKDVCTHAPSAWDKAKSIANGRDVWFTNDNKKWFVVTGIEPEPA